MTLGSLCSGIGGFELCAERVGITPLWLSEIDRDALKVTAKRFPDVPNVGDMTLLDGAKLPPVDIITGGTPCQSFSSAGNGEGLNGASGLFYHYIRIIGEMRNATAKSMGNAMPRYVVWENVKGAFSTGVDETAERLPNGKFPPLKGEDFRKVLESFAVVGAGESAGLSVPRPEKGKWKPSGEIVGDTFSICWRVLNAQYCGVPQRRERIALVADFGGYNAAEILFEHEGLRGNCTKGDSADEITATYALNRP